MVGKTAGAMQWAQIQKPEGFYSNVEGLKKLVDRAASSRPHCELRRGTLKRLVVRHNDGLSSSVHGYWLKFEANSSACHVYRRLSQSTLAVLHPNDPVALMNQMLDQPMMHPATASIREEQVRKHATAV
eukprot:SAG11_NODE_3986_length_2120_cov_2.716477_1_plen_129_part_00